MRYDIFAFALNLDTHVLQLSIFPFHSRRIEISRGEDLIGFCFVSRPSLLASFENSLYM